MLHREHIELAAAEFGRCLETYFTARRDQAQNPAVLVPVAEGSLKAAAFWLDRAGADRALSLLSTLEA